MEKHKKIKLYIGLFYLVLIALFLYFFFSKFSIQEITSYEFIKNNRDYFFELKQVIFIIFNFLIIYSFMGISFLGFGSPIALLGGLILGKWIGT